MNGFENKLNAVAESLSHVNSFELVIVPKGENGERLGEILRTTYKKKVLFYLDNYKHNGRDVFSLDNIPLDKKQTLYILTVWDEQIRKELLNRLISFTNRERIIDIFGNKDEKRLVCMEEDKVHLDFLSPGFAKCGTSSFHKALSDHPKIFLPSVKETYFLNRMNCIAHKGFRKSYSQKSAHELAGGIETSYFFRAKEVEDYFGREIKLIFCLRNPVQALFSYFKMDMRNVESNWVLDLIKRWGGVDTNSFGDYADHYFERYRYAKFIDEYIKRFDREHIYYVISEEVFQNPQKEMEKVQSFLGFDEHDKVDYKEFPHWNKSMKVSKDVASACINHALLSTQSETDPELYQKIATLRGDLLELTTKTFHGKIPEETGRTLMEKYMPGIHDLEDLMGRSLKGIWY